MMSIRKGVAVTLIAFLTLGGFPTALSARQSDAACSAAIDKLEAETQQLGKDLNADVQEFIKSDVQDTALKGIRNHYKSKATSEAVFDLKDKWDKFNTWAEYVKNARVSMEDLTKCINTRGCSLLEFAKRQNEAIAKWIEHLGDEGLTAAADRATKAGNILRTYAERTLSTATNGMMDTLGKCNAKFEQQANTNNTTTDNTTPGNNPPPSNKGGGGGSGKLIVGLLATGAAVAGGVVAAGALKDSLDEFSTIPTSSTTSSTTSGGGGSSTSITGNFNATVTRQCSVGAGNVNPLSSTFIEPCSQATAGGSCGPTSFTVTITNGVLRDCGGWLNVSGTGGSYSGAYLGSCGASTGVSISGTVGSNGGTLSGQSTCRGNVYTTTVSITR